MNHRATTAQVEPDLLSRRWSPTMTAILSTLNLHSPMLSITHHIAPHRHTHSPLALPLPCTISYCFSCPYFLHRCHINTVAAAAASSMCKTMTTSCLMHATGGNVSALLTMMHTSVCASQYVERLCPNSVLFNKRSIHLSC